MSKAAALVLAVVLAGLAAGALWWYSERMTERPTAVAPAPAPEPAPAPVAAEPAVKYPIEEPAATALTAQELPSALTALLGRKAVSSFFQLDQFPRRFVATLDNLGRAHAPPVAWPVNPAPGRFTVTQGGESTTIAPDNASRYTPFVLMVEAVNTARAVELYTRMYPLLQQAYADLGFPKRYFNDRVVEVIDLLLATPEIEGPVKLHLTEVKGSVPSERPWVRYQYEDPALEALASGQKILVRMGPVNERRLKAKLAELRRQITKAAPAR
jgi:hypothetical protein